MNALKHSTANWRKELENSPNYDPTWKASDPYPSWPFTRVRPEELEKFGRLNTPPSPPAPF